MPDHVVTAPYSIEAEQMVVGSVLIDAESINHVLYLDPDDFFLEANGTIFRLMLEMRDAGIRVNQITVSEALNSRQLLSKVGGAAYLSMAIASVPTSLDIEHYAAIIRRCSVYRKLLAFASIVADYTQHPDANISLVLDKCETQLREIRQSIGLQSRTLKLGEPRLIETNPPRYIWNVNGKDIHLTLHEITKWGNFKNRVISELNFVPIKPKDWDNTINNLITSSKQIAAPADASEEQQLKITIAKWFDRMREAGLYSDLAVGRHVVKEFGGITYYFFKSTPLLEYLRKENRRGINSEDLWISCQKWGGTKRKLRVKTPTGSMPVDLWGLPIDFLEEVKKLPDWF